MSPEAIGVLIFQIVIGTMALGVFGGIMWLIIYHVVMFLSPHKKEGVSKISAAQATTELAELKEEQSWLRVDDYCDWQRDNMINRRIGKLEKIIGEVVEEVESCPFMELGQAEVEEALLL